MLMKSSIQIKEILSPFISSRASIDIVKKEINRFGELNIILIDFDDVVLISSSFAHELVLLSKNIKQKIEIINANKNILSIIQSVKNRTSQKLKDYDDVPVTRYKNDQDLQDFLKAI